MQPKVPQYQQPPDDPAYDALKQQADQDQTAAMGQRIAIDSASLMARYGTRLAMAASGGASPAAMPSPTAPIAMLPSGINPVLGGVANTFKLA